VVGVMIMKFSLYGSPIPLVFAGKFHPEILTGSPERGVKQECWETSSLQALCVSILKTVRDTLNVTTDD